MATLGVLVLVLVLEAGGGAPVPAPAGLPDPGALTGWGLPVVRFGADLVALVIVGCAMVPALAADRLDSPISAAGPRAVFAVRPLTAVWAVLVAAQLVLTFSDQFAVPAWQVELRDLSGFARQVDQGRALIVQLVLVLLLGLASRWLVSVRESLWLLGLALGALVPPLLTGHSAAAGSHDTAIVSLVVHVLVVALWCGGVVALWWHLAGDGPRRNRAGRRFSSLAVWCVGLTLASGLVNALVRLGGVAPFVTSSYGRLVLVKLLAVLAVGVVAARARTVVLGRWGAAVGRRDAAGRLATLTALELALMSTALGIGVGLGRTPPPVGEIYVSAAEGLLGGPLPPAPSIARLLWSWTPSGVGLLVVGLGGAAYAVGVWTLRRRGVHWPVRRTAVWLAGLCLVGYATSGGVGTYSHVMFSAHMASHMVLSMVAPILLVLGAPVTLALRALPGGDGPRGQGPRHWLAGLLRSRVVRLLTHPLFVAPMFVGSLYAIYVTGIFEALMVSHLGHGFMEVHFLIAGCLYFEILVGSAPIPSRPSHLGRLLMLLVVMPFHAFFAVAVMSASTIIGEGYYRLLDRGYATDLAADQYLGGSLTWATGEVPMVLVLLLLLAQWYRADSRLARRFDAQAARDDDAERLAYNRMLGTLADHDSDER